MEIKTVVPPVGGYVYPEWQEASVLGHPKKFLLLRCPNDSVYPELLPWANEHNLKTSSFRDISSLVKQNGSALFQKLRAYGHPVNPSVIGTEGVDIRIVSTVVTFTAGGRDLKSYWYKRGAAKKTLSHEDQVLAPCHWLVFAHPE